MDSSDSSGKIWQFLLEHPLYKNSNDGCAVPLLAKNGHSYNFIVVIQLRNYHYHYAPGFNDSVIGYQLSYNDSVNGLV